MTLHPSVIDLIADIQSMSAAEAGRALGGTDRLRFRLHVITCKAVALATALALVEPSDPIEQQRTDLAAKDAKIEWLEDTAQRLRHALRFAQPLVFDPESRMFIGWALDRDEPAQTGD